MAEDDNWQAWNSANSALAADKTGCVSATAEVGY